jgi:hypothetical protein
LSSARTPDEEPSTAESQSAPVEQPGEVGAEDAQPDAREAGAAASARRWRAALQKLSIEPFWFGLAAFVLAWCGQRILMPGQDVALTPDFVAAKRWYIVAVGVLLFGWWGTYTNHSLLARGRDAGWNVIQRVTNPTNRIRLGVVAVAVIANLVAILILNGDWYSFWGGWLWAVSMLLLALAFIGERPQVDAVDEETDVESPRWHVPRWAEAVVVILILTLAFIMRAWRLGDLHPGMHGDEGEAGTISLAILNGVPTSPFGRGWFMHSNIYFWSVAICMKIFGTGLIGLRSWAVICGVVSVLFVYLIARDMFGVRAAIIAGFFLAFQSADALMSRQLSSNAATPAFTAVAIFFLVRGMRTKKHIYFVLAGLSAGFNVYYFAGGRLTALTILAFLVYMALMHRAFLKTYWTRLAAFGTAVVSTVAPFLAYNFAYPLPANTYPNDRFIWLHHADLAAAYGTSDWRTIVWDQLQRTLAVFTWAPDFSANHILDYPIARPLEAVLIVLGIAWMMWRWKDARFALLAIWFWTTLIVGGVLTIDAPNVPRLVALLPVVPIIMAAWLDHLAGQLQATIGNTVDTAAPRLTPWLSGAAVGSVVLLSGIQNWDKYINYYLNTHNQSDVTEQAFYVHEMGTRYRYYDLGVPALFFTHGDNRFINPNTDGIDMVNPSSDLPIVDNGPNGEKDVIFLVWPDMYDYLPVLQAYYPEGRQQSHPFSTPQDNYYYPPLISYLVTHSQMDNHRMLHVRFVSRRGPAVERLEPAVGLARPPPSGLTYPVQAGWQGGIVAPANGSYRFRTTGPRGTRLSIDGSPASGKSMTLAQGVHTIRLDATLPNSRARVGVEWATPDTGMAPIPRRFIWDGHIGRAWSGVVTQGTSGVLERRIDGFLGFREAQIDPGQLAPYNARWTSNLHVARAGLYDFRLNSNGSSSLLVDGAPVINNASDGSPHAQSGNVMLSPGVHRLEVNYNWQLGPGYLEAWWTPPGGKRSFLITPALSPPR